MSDVGDLAGRVDLQGAGGAAGITMAAPFEADYQAALTAMRTTKRWPPGLVLVLSLAAFVLLQEDRSPAALGVLIGVLLLHELGHYAGMRLFGYRDVRMFFIPFFGAAVSGRSSGAAAWKEGLVLLLGPVPGIVAALVLAVAGSRDPEWGTSLSRQIAISLVTINLLNLLPLAGLDGARLLQRVLFSRRRWLELTFQLLTALATVAFAIAIQSIVFGFLTYFMVILLPYRWRLLREAGRLRETGVVLPADARDLEADAGRTVYQASLRVVSSNHHRPKNLGAAMEQLVEVATIRPPGAAASVALGLTWLVALFLGLVAMGVIFRPALPDHQLDSEVDSDGFTTHLAQNGQAKHFWQLTMPVLPAPFGP